MDPLILTRTQNQDPVSVHPNRKSGRRSLFLHAMRFGLLIVVVTCVLPFSGMAQSGPQEYQVKAVFLSKFASFITWPDRAFSGSGAPITIGILGADPFGRYLDEAVQGESINGHPLKIRRIQSSGEAAECQIVFIREKDPGRVSQLLAPLRGTPVLTVGESPRFTQRGGIVNFAIVDGRVRLEFNPDEADRAGLKVSSKLMSVASIVK